jgi:hypothetical protein
LSHTERFRLVPGRWVERRDMSTPLKRVPQCVRCLYLQTDQARSSL